MEDEHPKSNMERAIIIAKEVNQLIEVIDAHNSSATTSGSEHLKILSERLEERNNLDREKNEKSHQIEQKRLEFEKETNILQIQIDSEDKKRKAENDRLKIENDRLQIKANSDDKKNERKFTLQIIWIIVGLSIFFSFIGVGILIFLVNSGNAILVDSFLKYFFGALGGALIATGIKLGYSFIKNRHSKDNKESAEK